MKIRFDGPRGLSLRFCLLLLFASSFETACTEDVPAPAPPEAPAIRAFTASPGVIAPGASTELHYEVDHADALVLLDDTGVELPLDGATRQGAVTVTPQRTTLYILRASRGEQTVVAEREVGVVGTPPVATLRVVPSEVHAGETVQLIWSNPLGEPAELRDGAGNVLPLEAGARAGILSLHPLQSTEYRLSFRTERPQAPLEARVRVRPLVSAFDVQPANARPGQTVTFRWQVSGGQSLDLEEQTFGRVTELSGLEGTNGPGLHTWVVPSTLPSGEPAPSDIPLAFTLRLSGREPGEVAQAHADGWLGDGPFIALFDAPPAVTQGRPVSIRWKTRNAHSLRVLVGGLPVYAPLASQTEHIAEGRVSLPAPSTPTEYTLEIRSKAGQVAKATQRIRTVPPPLIERFAVPVLAAKAGASVQASWQTKDVSALVIRLQDGPNVFYSASAEEVARGATNLLPLRKTTYLLEAYNAAGDVVTAARTVDVRQPAPLSATPSVAFADTPVSVRHDFGDIAPRELYGVPDVSPEVSDAGAWLELEREEGAKQLIVEDPHESVAEIVVPGFRFPFIDDVHSRFHVSVNGLLSFAPLASPMPANTGLPSGTLPPLLAPYWDDLFLASNGRLLWLVEGTRYPRRLVVQWSNVRPVAEVQTNLRFQVQLDETGEFRFLYHTVSSAEPAGAGATIGAQHAAARFPAEDLVVVGGTRVQSDQSLRFFASPYNGLEWSQFVFDHARFSAVAQLEDGSYAAASLPVWVHRPESIRVSEVMPAPREDVAPASAWIELHNDGDVEVDLGGLALSTTESAEPWTLPMGTRVRPGEHLVLAPTVDPTRLDGVPATVAYGEQLPMSDSDVLRLQLGPNTVSSLAWDGTVPGRSVVPLEPFVDAAGQPVRCERDKTFGQNNSVGTPGQANESCRAYRKQHATPNYRDISRSGVPLFRSSGLDSSVAKLDFGAHPVPLFGQPTSAVHVSTNGFVSLSNTLSATYTFEGALLPSAASPADTLAIFGEDLKGNDAFASANVYAEWIPADADTRRPVGHWIIQWHHFSPSDQKAEDDLNFQLKLFEDGVVEYHYGALLQHTFENDRAQGEKATIWLQDAARTALIVSAQRASLRTNLAFRFVPVKP